MYKVFFNENQIIISDNPIETALKSQIKLVHNPTNQAIQNNFESLDEQGDACINFWGRKDMIWKAFKEQFTWIEAAGGWVVNQQNELLLIYRLKRWDLPKGKIEKGEGVEEAAIREVEEETGLSKLSISKTLPSSYHIYPRKGKMYLKQTHWFKMVCADEATPVPQIEEDIEKVEWVALDELAPYAQNTYPAIAELMKEQSC